MTKSNKPPVMEEDWRKPLRELLLWHLLQDQHTADILMEVITTIISQVRQQTRGEVLRGLPKELYFFDNGRMMSFKVENLLKELSTPEEKEEKE